MVQKTPKYFVLRNLNGVHHGTGKFCEWKNCRGAFVLLKMAEDLPLNGPIEQVWKLLRDTPRFAELLPGVENVVRLNGDGNEVYAAKVSEKIGPFKISMNLEVHVTESVEPSMLKASLKGEDSMGLNRITGSMQVELTGAETGTQMHFEASIEVLGKLATLGAVPIRRRTTQVFAEFAKNIQRQFAGDTSPASNA
jgi:carbon monoxide dehydrogenase subunit G